MSGNLEVLAQHRNALLLAEIAAWLHMLGKFHEDFLCGELSLATKIPDDLQSKAPELYNLLTDTWTGKIWATLPIVEFQAANLSISKLIQNHHDVNSQEGFLKLFFDAHGRGAATEKGVLARFAPQQKTMIYLLTSLGYELNTPIELAQIQHNRLNLYNVLEEQLSFLKTRNADLNLDAWIDFCSKFHGNIERTFRMSTAETRRPLSDVTLFDQTMATVAFFKTSLAFNLLKGWKEPGIKGVTVAQKYRWRLIRIGLDSQTFWGNSIRISDLLARKECITAVLDRVKILLEIVYPLGLEIYRDVNGSVFMIPDIEDLPKYNLDKIPLEDYIQNIVLSILNNESKFVKFTPSRETRNTLLFGQIVTAPLPPPTPDLDKLHQAWQEQEKVRDICSVCGLRPLGPSLKSANRKLCNICEERRQHRVHDWLQTFAKNKQPIQETVWIDEVADIHGRLALLTAQFDLSQWLSGSVYNTVLSFNICPRLLTDEGRRNTTYDFRLAELLKDIHSKLTSRGQPPAFSDQSLLGRLVLKDNRDQSNTVQAFYNIRITDTDLEQTPSLSNAERLVLEMIRLSPSFSRIYRVWHTTQTFWREIASGFEVSRDQQAQIRLRLKITGIFTPISDVRTTGITHTYELKVDNVNISIVCIANGQFLTVDNLQRTALLLGAPSDLTKDYISATNYLRDRLLQARFLEIEEPTGYGSANKLLGKLHITDVVIDTTPYVPAITLLTEPRTFMLIVPADQAMDVARSIKDKYEKEVGKVRNRLPLTLGIVFAGRRTPLPAILNAGRRMLKQPTKEELWEISKIDVKPESVELILTKGENSPELLITQKTKMGDNSTEDVWYPFWCVEKDGNGTPLSARQRQFKGINSKQWLHVRDLKEGDQVYITPSRFDFEFLDTAARRFEISYEDSGQRRGSQRPTRPYYLEQLASFERLWNILSEGLETSQIYNLTTFIETKRTEWDTPINHTCFQQVVRDALNNAQWKSGHRPKDTDFNNLCHAALNGQLADIVELYMRILKGKN